MIFPWVPFFKDTAFGKEPHSETLPPSGRFVLERRRPYPCAVDNCNVDMVKHVRHFVHGRAVVRLQLQELKDQATSDENDVACWTLCKRCKQVKRKEKKNSKFSCRYYF